MKRNLGLKMIGVVIALLLVVPAVAETKYASLPMVEKVTNAVPTDELIVVVHQFLELEKPTISLLDQPLYTNTPRVVLTDGASYPPTPSLLDRATMIQYSKEGELSLDVNAKTVTLLGGSANDCLRRSSQILIKEILNRPGRRKLAIRIPSDVVWGWKGGITRFCKGNPAEFDSKVKEFALDFINREIPNLFSITRIYQVIPGRAGEMDYYFVFTRKSDGKKVNLILEQLCDVL